MRPLILLLLSSLLLACSSNTNSNAKVLRLNGHTMGTMWSVKLVLEDATAANFYWEAIQDELDNINNKLYATVDEDIPDEYRDLVEEYYRVLSENQGSANTDQ